MIKIITELTIKLEQRITQKAFSYKISTRSTSVLFIQIYIYVWTREAKDDDVTLD